MMWPLPELQMRLLDSLLQGSDCALPALRPEAPGQLSSARRLQVYRNNVRETLVSALAGAYPVVAQLVGDEFFRQTARSYLRTHPPHSGTLVDYGGGLPAFLRRLDAVAALPYLGDVAALEWAVQTAYHEAVAAPLALSALAALPAEHQAGLRLKLQPSAQFVSSPWPVLAIWRAHQPGADASCTISLDEGGANLLVVQQALDVEFRPLSRAEHLWLRLLARRRTLAEATAAAMSRDAGFALAAALARHFADGLFTGFDLEAKP